MPRLPRTVFLTLVALAIVIVLDQTSDLAINLRPYHPEQVSWRIGAFGLASGRTTALVLADGLTVVGLLGLEARKAIRAWALAHLLAVVALGAALVMFGLDAVELAASMPPETRPTMIVAAGRAGIVGLGVAGLWLWIGAAGLLSTRPRPGADRGAGAKVVVLRAPSDA